MLTQIRLQYLHRHGRQEEAIRLARAANLDSSIVVEDLLLMGRLEDAVEEVSSS
jgi:3,4-dihydroxy-2-butanone 4-phosphate synthase